MNEMNTVSEDYSSLHAELWSQSFVDSQNRTEAFREVLKRVPPHNSIPDTKLGMQMNVVYQLITAAAAKDLRKINRDAFAIEMGGYDVSLIGSITFFNHHLLICHVICTHTFVLNLNRTQQHFSQKSGLSPLFRELDDAVAGFRRALKSQGILHLVTLIIHSEFGRTLSPNGGGGSGKCSMCLSPLVCSSHV